MIDGDWPTDYNPVMIKKRFGFIACFLGAACVWGLSPSAISDPVESLRRNKAPLILAEQFLVIQETAPVVTYRTWLAEKGKTDLAQKIACLEYLYAGNTPGAIEALGLVQKKDEWTLERDAFLRGLADVQKAFVETRSDHFIVRTAEEQSFLAPHALASLETAYGRLAGLLDGPLGAPVVVEIYPSLKDYAVAAQTSGTAVATTGAATCVRFGRILALSPGATAFGYRWIDGLIHEYVHGQVTRLTGDNAPFWLQEGTARRLEGAWRLSGAEAMTSYDRNLLTRAALESLVSLSSDKGCRNALFSAASFDAVNFLTAEFGEDKRRELLTAFRRLPDPFLTVLGIAEPEFEIKWVESLNEFTETPTGADRGALGPSIMFDTTDDLVLTNDNVRPLLSRGDVLLKKGAVSDAVIEYKKAVDLQPDNGVALVRLAQVYEKERKWDGARDLFIRAKTHNPSYAPSFVGLGQMYFDEGRYEEAQSLLQDAIEIRPFDPLIHETLGLIAVDVGNFSLARQSLGLALRFDPTNVTVREALDNMPKPR